MSKKYCNLYSFVKNHNANLISIIDDLCAEGLFKGKGKKTFLNPNSKLVKQLEDEINKGNSDEALTKLKSLFLVNDHAALGKKMYETFNHKEVDGSTLDVSPSKNYKKWNPDSQLNVLELNSTEFPKEGNETKSNKDIKNGSGEIYGSKESSVRVEVTNELINDYLKNDDSKVFIYGVNSLLTFLKKKEPKLYETASKLVDSNLVVSWYILVQPTAKTSKKHIPDSIFKRWAKGFHKSPLKNAETLKELFNSNSYDNKELKSIIEKRKGINSVGLKETISEVVNVYNSDYLKLLQDELRFRFTDSCSLDGEDIMTLNLVDWDKPRKSLVLFENIPKSNLLQSEIYKLITKFIKSNAFLYTPYNDDIIQKIQKNISGAGSGSNNLLYICGSNEREKIKNMTCGSLEFSLEDFVGGLTSEQVNELKSYL